MCDSIVVSLNDVQGVFQLLECNTNSDQICHIPQPTGKCIGVTDKIEILETEITYGSRRYRNKGLAAKRLFGVMHPSAFFGFYVSYLRLCIGNEISPVNYSWGFSQLNNQRNFLVI